MKKYVFIAIVVIILILLVLAWKKETVESSEWQFEETTEESVRIPEKAPKSRHPNSKEEKCRDIFESLTGRAYPTVRPHFLRNPSTGRNLELDGYCEELRSAFEYQGSQHYEFPNRFHKTKQEFLAQVERDKFKVQRCAEEGINLVVIPHVLKDDELEDFIRTKLSLV